ncbi:TniQ family protein [Pseudomonas marginalis]|uniref:TniQ family protein n=1 Tax=Pseudomonas TaxID=286 RepID=UPI00389AA031
MKIFTPLPGEYVASVLQRGNEMLGLKTITLKDFHIKPLPRKGYGYALGHKYESRAHAVFQFPDFFTERNVSEEVLKNHTLYPLTAALARTRKDIAVTPAVWRKICPICALEDFENYGTAYVHRKHVPTSVQVCSVHGSRLMDRCTTCLTLIKNHQISRLSICSQKYKSQVEEPDSFSFAYSKFVADLLTYNGATPMSYRTDWLIINSIRLRYGNEIKQNENFIKNLIKNKFGVDLRTPISKTYSDNNYTILAFLGCETAEVYFKLLLKSEASSRQVK